MASSAPIQRIAGPIRDRRLRSGPTANGHDGDHREEEDQPDQRAAAAAKLEPRGLAGDGGERAGHAAAPSDSVAAGVSGSGRWVAAIDHAAAGEMRGDEPAQHRLGRRVERRRRLVEEPDRAFRDEQAGERDAPLLARREARPREDR